jgi:hypothetical protein
MSRFQRVDPAGRDAIRDRDERVQDMGVSQRQSWREHRTTQCLLDAVVTDVDDVPQDGAA